MTRIRSRAEWGARPARSRHVTETPTPRLWLHHSAGALDAGGNGVWWDDVRGIQDFHMRDTSRGGRGWSDIAYSFLIGGGQVFEGRGVGIAGGHTAGENRVSHGICVIGNYEVMRPHIRDLEALAWLVRHGREQGWWGELTGPHRDAPGASTACCGRHLIACIPDVRRMAATATPKPAPTAPVEPMEDRMIWHIKDSPYSFLHLGGREFLPLTEATFWHLAGQGVRVVTVTNDVFQSRAAVDGQGSLLHGAAYGG